MFSLFFNPSTIEHNNVIKVLDALKAVRDCNQGSLAGSAFDGVADPALGLGIQRAACLVEKQYVGIAQKRSCNCDALALAA